MAFFRIQKHILADPVSFGAMQRCFSSLKEIHPLAETDHPTFKWFQVTGEGIPDDPAVEIELEFQLVSHKHALINWRRKEIL